MPHVSLVTCKTKVAPIKRLTVSRLELCGAHLLANLLHHVQEVFDIPSDKVFAWTDSTVVLSWLVGSPRRFKTFMCNRISTIMELTSPAQWHHVSSPYNPADCASRGLFPSELLQHNLWWNGPEWLCESTIKWPNEPKLVQTPEPVEEKEICLNALADVHPTLPILERFSEFTHLKRVTAWVFRFVENCRVKQSNDVPNYGFLSLDELSRAERYWLQPTQAASFPEEIANLKKGSEVCSKGCLLSLHPFIDQQGLLRMSGRVTQSNLPYSYCHPIILPGNHTVTKLLIRMEHLRLLHAGPTLVAASLHHRYHIIGSRRVIRSVARECVICRRTSIKPSPQVLGQLPVDRLTPGTVFDRVGIDYAGPVFVKRGPTSKPILLLLCFHLLVRQGSTP